MAIIRLLLDTGLRKSEVCRLQLDDTDLEKCTLQVQIKGGRWGTGVFTEETRDYIEDWLGLRSYIAQKDVSVLFTSVGGTRPGTQITPDGMSAIFGRISRQAGFKLSPHDLRRTMACELTKKGAPTELVRKAGRWSSFSMVQIYTQQVPVETIRDYLPRHDG